MHAAPSRAFRRAFLTVLAEEWLHLAFNVSLLTAVLLFWHVIEHLVVTGNMIANGGCPCPGIFDRFVPETMLHLGYNAIALGGLAAVVRAVGPSDPVPINTPEREPDRLPHAA